MVGKAHTIAGFVMVPSSRAPDYPDDIFADTRMSFGDHIEELRMRLVRALLGLVVALLGGFVLDAVGQAIGVEDFGIGRPMLKVIVDPAEKMVKDFYAKRNAQKPPTIPAPEDRPSPAEVARIREKIAKDNGSYLSLTDEGLATLRKAPAGLHVYLPVGPLTKAFGEPKDPAVAEVPLTLHVYPTELNKLMNEGEFLRGNRQYITTLSVQEAFMVYFKVSLLCGVVLASPWILFQLWAFVAAGLYPHERAYVYKFFGPSVGLFLAGVLLCQFIVLPGAVKALIAFNSWVDLDPDLRLNEWLGFALILPVVFGVSFQTPLVMLFLNRIGMFTAADYLAKWRYAVLVLAVFAAVITPTPDVVTMMYLFVPMFGLYMLGIGVCHFFPASHEDAWQEDEQQVAV